LAESSSPVVARWELSRRLAARRKELGVDVKTITNALGFTRNYWSAVENDRTLIAEEKLRLLFDVLSFDESDQSELLQLREDSRGKGWWDEYPTLTSEHKRFYGMETGASHIRAYGSHLVPGVIQTDAYARAVIAADPAFSPVEIEQMVRVRQERQSHMLQSRPDRLLVLISEAVLRQQVAGADAQGSQLEHLLELTSSAEAFLTVRVLPFDVNPGAIVNSTTLLFFEYDSPHLATTAWQEGVQLFDGIESNNDEYRRLDLAWQTAIDRSLDSESSLDMIRRASASLADRSRQPSDT